MASNTYLNRYRIVTGPNGSPVELDRSPTGAVYRAEDIESGNAVALRVIDLQAVEASAPENLERIAAGLKQLRHVNVPEVYDYTVEGNRLICAAELLEGTAADAWVTAHGPMPVGTALRIATQVVGALAAATFRSLVHPAINPANILLVPGQTPEGDWPLIKVLNFLDVSPVAGDETARRFASPEQLLGAATDFRSEIYSLGCTLSYLLTGDVPATSGEFRARGVPKPVAALITHMLATDPTQRPQDPVAFQEEIRACLAQTERREAIGRRFGLPVGTPDKPVVHTARTPGVLMKPLALAAGLMVLGGIGALLMANGVFSRKDTAIGVPVGVPETTAVASADTQRNAPPADAPPVTLAAAPSAAPQTNPAPATDDSAPEVASNAPVLTSQPIDEPPTAEPDASAAPAVAMNDPEPASPAEGPATTSQRNDSTRASESLAQAQRQDAPESLGGQPPVFGRTETAAPPVTQQPARESTPPAQVVEAAQPKPSATPARVAKAATPAPKKPANRVARTEVRRATPVSDAEAGLAAGAARRQARSLRRHCSRWFVDVRDAIGGARLRGASRFERGSSPGSPGANRRSAGPAGRTCRRGRSLRRRVDVIASRAAARRSAPGGSRSRI
jgi:serine/threonine-protein kinase